MVIKQKRSAALSAVVYVLLCGVVIAAWLTNQWFSNQFHSFHEPILSSPIVYAEAEIVEDQPNPIDVLEADLQAAVNQFASRHGDGYSVYVEHLDTRTRASHKANASMTAASMYKPFVVNEALKMIENGQLVEDAIVDGSRQLSLRDCMRITITVSDNPCGAILQRITGAANSSLPALSVQGFDNTDLRGVYPTTTAKDIGRLFVNLHNQSYLNARNNQFFLDVLGEQTVTNRLPQGLPAGTTIHHKTGDLNGYAHDGGLIETDNGWYVIVIMSRPSSAGNLNDRYAVMAQLSRDVHEIIDEAKL